LSFLFQAAQQILSDHPDNLHNALVLLPNKRGEIFLKRELARQLEKPALAPAMLTIEEFVQKASGYHKQSQLQLLIGSTRFIRKRLLQMKPSTISSNGAIHCCTILMKSTATM
jgi:hypothetical protein